MRGGAERPESAARFRARGSGVDAREESDHQGSHGPVITSVGAVGKAEQAGFLQGVCILRLETDPFLHCSFQTNTALERNDFPPRFGTLPSPRVRFEGIFSPGVFISYIITVIQF